MKWLDWFVQHSKNICYLLIGLDVAAMILYSVRTGHDFPTGVITVIGLVYGIGAARSINQAHTDAKIKTATAPPKK